MSAARHGYTDVVAELVKAKANLNLQNSVNDSLSPAVFSSPRKQGYLTVFLSIHPSNRGRSQQSLQLQFTVD